MANREQAFRHSDVVRGLRAARAAGLDSPTLRIRTPDGVEYHFSDGGEVAAPKRGADVPRVRGKLATPVRSPNTVSKDRLPGEGNRAPLAEGGSRHGMFKEQAADTAAPGRTAKVKAAAAFEQASGGICRPAKPA